MIRIQHYMLALLLFASVSPSHVLATPNILLIMIDDLGWMDLACQGNPLVETPRVDRLATEGMRFTNAYAAAPVCSPSRASILTGKSPARLHITNHTPDRAAFTPDDAILDPAPMLNHLPLEHVTVAELLQKEGYRTGFFGKWHLSGPGKGDAKLDPLAQGFDVNVGGCGYGGPPTFFDPYDIPTITDRRKGEYLPDRLSDEVIDFMRAEREKPFMLFLWNYTVHWPMEAPEPLLEKYKTRTGPGLNDTRYGAMIEAMDRSMGKVLDELDRLGIREETLVIFTSDNGGYGGVADNRPLRESKGHLFEGGIRVPMIVRWSGVVEANSTSAEPVIGTDLFSTMLEVAGVKSSEPSDGQSIVPVLRGEPRLDRDAIYFHYPNYAWHKSNRLGAAIRARQYKLIHRFDDDSVELFDLDADLSETTNLAGKMPEKAAELKKRLSRWLKDANAAMPVAR